MGWRCRLAVLRPLGSVHVGAGAHDVWEVPAWVHSTLVWWAAISSQWWLHVCLCPHDDIGFMGVVHSYFWDSRLFLTVGGSTVDLWSGTHRSKNYTDLQGLVLTSTLVDDSRCNSRSAESHRQRGRMKPKGGCPIGSARCASSVAKSSRCAYVGPTVGSNRSTMSWGSASSATSRTGGSLGCTDCVASSLGLGCDNQERSGKGWESTSGMRGIKMCSRDRLLSYRQP